MPSHAKYVSPENILPEMSGFFFIVDTCSFDAARHEILIEALNVMFEGIPDDCLVGFIKFGTNIELIEINKSNPKRTYLFSGQTEYTNKTLSNLDSLSVKGTSGVIGKFLKILF